MIPTRLSLCPEITEDTPQFYHDLMEKSWHCDPTQRQTAKEIYKVWSDYPTQGIKEQIEKAEEIRKKDMEIKKETKTSHPGGDLHKLIINEYNKW